MILVFSAGILAAAPLGAQQPVVRAVRVEGTLRPVTLRTQAGQPLDPQTVSRDLHTLWQTGWFADIRVERIERVVTRGAGEGVEVVFRVAERPRLYLRKIEFEPSSRSRKLALKEGDPLDVVTARRTAAAVRRQLLAEGHHDASVQAEILPAGFQQADLLLRVKAGPRYVVEQVQFAGDLGVPAGELHRAVRAMRARRLLPGVPRLWKGWRLLAPYSDEAVEADLAELRSFYLARGYLDARARLAGVEINGSKVTVRIRVDAGRPYRITAARLSDFEPAEEIPLRETMGAAPEFPAEEICRCLRRRVKLAETHGSLGANPRVVFSPEEISDAGPRQESTFRRASLDVSAGGGPEYRIGRIEFRGHHAVSDSTLRRTLTVKEGELLNLERLRKSLASLSRIGSLEPLRQQDVVLVPRADSSRADILIRVREKDRGLWSLAGPLGSPAVFGPLEFALKSRLPGLGSGLRDLSTYRATFSLLWGARPSGEFPFRPQLRLIPIVGVERPLLPGQSATSGFLLSPQLGWQGIVGSYVQSHAYAALGAAQQKLAGGEAGLLVPVWRKTNSGNKDRQPDAQQKNSVFAGLLRCPAPRSRWKKLGTVGLTAANILLQLPLF